MEFKVSDIAALLEGVVEGNGELMINNVSKIEEGKEHTLAFLSNPKYENYIYTTAASAVLINHDFVLSREVSCTLIRVPSAYDAIASLLQMYEEVLRPRPRGIEEPSYIGEGATIGDNPYIGAFAYIGKGAKIGNNVQVHPQAYVGEKVVIGDNTILHAGVKIYYGCVLGHDCTIHAGTVIGADGFGFAPNGSDYKKVPQIGNVVIEDYVEVGANTCIDRATMGSTILKRGVKLDNLVQIAHNVVVGENTVMAAQAGVAGTSKVGANCMFGGQVAVSGHLTIGDRVMLAGQAGVSNNVAEGSVCMGSPAFEAGKFRKTYVLFRKLPDLYKQLNDLDKEIKILKSK